MAITFAVRGDSLTPRFNGAGGPGYGLAGQTTTVESDGTAIGGSVLDMDLGALNNMQVVYNGVDNWPATRACSVLIRAKFGTLTGAIGLFNCSAATRSCNGQLSLYINSSDFKAYMRNAGGSLGINNATISTHGMSTATWHDIVVTYTGTNSSNGFTVYVDGSSVGSLTSSTSWDATRKKVHSGLEIGRGGDNVNNTQMLVNEFVLWDEVITPTSVGLTSGTGSLNGSSRTAFVDVAAKDGSASGGPSLISLGSIGF